MATVKNPRKNALTLRNFIAKKFNGIKLPAESGSGYCQGVQSSAVRIEFSNVENFKEVLKELGFVRDYPDDPHGYWKSYEFYTNGHITLSVNVDDLNKYYKYSHILFSCSREPNK